MSLGEHFKTERRTPKQTYAWTLSLLQSKDDASRTAVAHLLAGLLMKRITVGAPQHFDAWERGTQRQRLAPDRQRSAPILAFVRNVFGPEDSPLPDDHAQGAVAEILWWFAVSHFDFPGSDVVKVYGPDIRVTSPGGDGLVIHRHGATGKLFFRLWETKKHAQKKGGISNTVGVAQQQIAANADRYLAQYTAIAEGESGELREVLSMLVEHWLTKSELASVGICIATDARPKRAFSGTPNKFPEFARPLGIEGLVTSIPDYAGFVNLVRERVWSGL